MTGVAAVAALAIAAALPGASGAGVPSVSAPEIQVPAVPEPVPIPVPVPVPQPPPVAVPVPAPEPVPAPALPAVPAVQAAPTLQAPTLTSDVVSAGSRVAAPGIAAAGGQASPPPERTRAQRAKGSDGRLFDTRYLKARRLVNRLSGCLDRIGRLPSRLLALRYGVGPGEPRPAARVARRLDLTMRQYDRVKWRGLRRLAVAARRSGCERVPASEFAILAGGGSAPAAAGFVQVAWSPGAGGSEAGGGVLGESRASGGGDDVAPLPELGDSPVASPSLDLTGPSSDLPFLLAVAAVSALFAWFVYRRARAAAERDRRQYGHDSP